MENEIFKKAKFKKNQEIQARKKIRNQGKGKAERNN
jgi:hypothetical protein